MGQLTSISPTLLEALRIGLPTRLGKVNAGKFEPAYPHLTKPVPLSQTITFLPCESISTGGTPLAGNRTLRHLCLYMAKLLKQRAVQSKLSTIRQPTHHTPLSNRLADTSRSRLPKRCTVANFSDLGGQKPRTVFRYSEHCMKFCSTAKPRIRVFTQPNVPYVPGIARTDRPKMGVVIFSFTSEFDLPNAPRENELL